MTTQAPPRPSPKNTQAQRTEPLGLISDERIVDSFALLDHRTRRRAVPDSLARRGPYLAFGDKLIPLDDKIVHIGRGLGAQIRIEDQRVSRSHAIIVRHGRHGRILDNRSANGTYVEGRRIIATNLNSGDEVCVGPVMMRYVEVG